MEFMAKQVFSSIEILHKKYHLWIPIVFNLSKKHHKKKYGPLTRNSSVKLNQPKIQQTNNSKPVKKSLNPTYSFLLLANPHAPVFTPNFFTLDSAGPKFVTLVLLNLVSIFLTAT
jgi:hypothetical protein